MPLIQLLPDQIMTHWEEIKPYIQQALPEIYQNDLAMLRIQENLLTNAMQGWMAIIEGEPRGFLTTTTVIDEISGTQNLLLYTFFAAAGVEQQTYIEGIETIRKFAHSRGCQNIIAYSSNMFVIRLAHGLGANIDTRLIYFKV